MKVSCPLSKYKDLFGKIGTGTHQYRFMDTAILDYVITIVAAIVMTYITKMPLVLTTIILFSVGIIIHIVFGVETNTTKYLGITCQ